LKANGNSAAVIPPPGVFDDLREDASDEK